MTSSSVSPYSLLLDLQNTLQRARAVSEDIVRLATLCTPADIREKGWSVAVHNDYRVDGMRRTFWGFSRGQEWVRGEGASDLEALDAVREQLGLVTSLQRSSVPLPGTMPPSAGSVMHDVVVERSEYPCGCASYIPLIDSAPVHGHPHVGPPEQRCCQPICPHGGVCSGLRDHHLDRAV